MNKPLFVRAFIIKLESFFFLGDCSVSLVILVRAQGCIVLVMRCLNE